MTRSRIMARSNSAKTPIIWNTARPDGVEVSEPCRCRTGPRPWHGARGGARAGRPTSGRADRPTRPPPCRCLDARRRHHCVKPRACASPLAPDVPASSKTRTTVQPWFADGLEFTLLVLRRVLGGLDSQIGRNPPKAVSPIWDFQNIARRTAVPQQIRRTDRR